MRGHDERSGSLFRDVDLEVPVAKDHPLRPIRRLVDAALRDLWAEFERLYAPIGRPSIPPERLVRALLMQAFYSVRSERQLMEQLGSNLLFRWLVGLGIDDPAWDATVLTKNRERLLAGEVALLRRARRRGKARIGWAFTLAAAAYNLIRLPKLLGAAA